MNAVTAADADVEYLAGLRSAWTRAFVVGELIGFVPPVLLATVLAPVWAMALTAMGYLQWRVLRVTIPASGRWVPVTTGAWLIGIVIPVVALSTVPNDRPVHVAVAGARGRRRRHGPHRRCVDRPYAPFTARPAQTATGEMTRVVYPVRDLNPCYHLERVAS
jgi:hypothetical protein